MVTFSSNNPGRESDSVDVVEAEIVAVKLF